MSAHVVVLDSQLRRATVKTTPNKPLSDVLSEACQKLSLDATNYGLKHKNKTVDLSRSIRLAGLSTGAKLELTKLSKSPSVVTVCLQPPESESQGIPNGRLVEKFPSSITLWLILRNFESASGTKRNYTARGVPQTKEGESGAGRLVHEGPVIQALDRELSSFQDLQKSLAQLGVNSGNVLLRLYFRVTDTPLEEALSEMEEYFKAVEGSQQGGAHAGAVGVAQSTPANDEGILPDDPAARALTPEPSNLQPPVSSTTAEDADKDMNAPPEATHQNDNSGPDVTNSTSPSIPQTTSPRSPRRSSVTVFAPPSASTPRAANMTFNENDYEPTIDHAKIHQSRLKDVGRNKRLPTDAEIAEQEAAQAEKRAAIKSVEIKVRMPDQSQVVDTFSDHDTNEDLYSRTRGWMQYEEEPIVLIYNAKKGTQPVPSSGPPKKLIKDLGMDGRVLVTMSWGDGASVKARQEKVLKPEYQAQAQEIPVPQAVNEVEMTESQGRALEPPKLTNDDSGKGKKVPAWAKGLFNKKR